MRLAPLFVLVLLLALPASAELDSFGLGTGRDGPLTVTAAGKVINAAEPLVASAPAGSRVLRLASTGFVGAGWLVLIHQSAGFPASTPSGGTGPVTPGAVGRWELARVETVDSQLQELRLTAPLVNGYTAPGAQVVCVPEYTTVTIDVGASLVAPPWDGRGGGILVFLATDTVTNRGRVSADGAGFRGGAFLSHANLNGCTGLDVPPAQGGAYKGEGVVVDRLGVAAGRGNLVNGGGGGNCNNAGGGGGGHAGAGGGGGRTGNVDGNRDEGGMGGASLGYSLLDRFLFGGGGGAGEGNNDAGSGGGAGGGVVLVRAAALSGAGDYSANGQDAATTPGEDGAGGGGAGGAVILRAAGQVDCGAVRARGGAGGGASEVSFPLGPGGGGGGGRVLLQGTAVGCPADVAGGPAGVTAADGTSFGASVGAAGSGQELLVSYRAPTTPTLSAPLNGAVGVSSRPRFEGVTDPGVRVIIFVDGVELTQVTSSSTDGTFLADYPALREPLSAGEHRVRGVAESLGAYSQLTPEVTFNVAVTLADGGVVVPPILVVPAEGDIVGPTPLFAGVAPNGLTVGVEVDNGAEVTVPVDAFGRFRYQVPEGSPLAPGPHFVTVHAHNEQGLTGPYSQAIRFEVGQGDGGTPDAGTGAPDGGGLAVPVVVVPAEGEVVDSTPLFAGAAAPGATVAIEVDGAEVARVSADGTGAFRYPVPSEKALGVGPHTVTASALVGTAGTGGARSPATGFEVRGPASLDVGCGCGASPASVAGAWALLAGLAAAVRRRRR
jgi:uncharacterized protein (TIGR03382 family)